MTTSVRMARSSCLRSPWLVVGASKAARRSAPPCRHQGDLFGGQRVGTSGGGGRERAFGAGDVGEALLPFVLERARHEPVLRLAVVELAARGRRGCARSRSS